MNMAKADSAAALLTDDKALLREIMTKLSVSVPTAGKALGDLTRNASYEVAKRDRKIAGCPVLEVGGKLRVPTAPIRKALGLEGLE